MGVEPKIGGKKNKIKWMVKIMENPIKMYDLGIPLFLETPTYLHQVNVASFYKFLLHFM